MRFRRRRNELVQSVRLVAQAIPAGQARRDHDIWMPVLTEGQGPKPAPLRLRNGAEEDPGVVPAGQLQNRVRMFLQVARLPRAEDRRHLVDSVVEVRRAGRVWVSGGAYGTQCQARRRRALRSSRPVEPATSANGVRSPTCQPIIAWAPRPVEVEAGTCEHGQARGRSSRRPQHRRPATSRAAGTRASRSRRPQAHPLRRGARPRRVATTPRALSLPTAERRRRPCSDRLPVCASAGRAGP